MLLESFHVKEFQSINDSNEIDVENITCLVGKNESGKTAVLQALYRLNPIVEKDGYFDVTEDYPRAYVEDYQFDIEKGEREHAVPIKATFRLEESDLLNLNEKFGDGILISDKLIINKDYNNTLFTDLEIDESVLCNYLVKKAKLPEEVANNFRDCTNINELIDKIEEITDEENKKYLIELNKIIEPVKDEPSIFIYDNYIKPLVPKFLHFDEYYQMTGEENIENLIKRKENDELKKSDHPLLGLIEIARMDLKQLLKPDRTQRLINKLEGASNYLSKKILNYWSQNKHIQIKFDVRAAQPNDPEGMTEGTNFWAQVHDSKNLVTTRFGTRSRGFVWFFSFLAWFDQLQKKDQKLILLLDEPGLVLHGKAQNDLLNYMEEELKNIQVIYTTHSPFMVDPKNFQRVKIVQNKSMESDEIEPEEEGTKVLTDILEATDDSLFPLQGALGYEIQQTLFIGPFCLVVEGVSDLLYLQSISCLLDENGMEGLNKEWVITPVGGSDKIPTFVSLLGSQEGITIATLIDIQNKDRQAIENLYKKKLLKKKNVITFADFTETEEADIEDMFELKFFLKIFNDEFSKELHRPIKTNDLKSGSQRVIVKMEDYLKRSFNHYRPARYFAENINNLAEEISSETLERFEKAFKEINKLIEK